MNAIRFCTELSLEPDQVAEARRLAIEENKENASPFTGQGRLLAAADNEPIPSPLMHQDLGSRDQARLALLYGKKWAVGRTLNIRFLNGSSFVQDKVKQFASMWQHFANIKFNFNGGANAEIRISFNPGGSNSYVGTDALSIPQNRQTMNFGWFDADTSDQEFSRTTIHEFGHALGCIHEHQNPTVSIPWDKRLCTSIMLIHKHRHGLRPKLIRTCSQSTAQMSLSTRSSTLRRSCVTRCPRSLTIGNYSIGWNNYLSPMDKTFINRAYPFSRPRSVRWLLSTDQRVSE